MDSLALIDTRILDVDTIMGQYQVGSLKIPFLYPTIGKALSYHAFLLKYEKNIVGNITSRKVFLTS